jgi:hypothetical protein
VGKELADRIYNILPAGAMVFTRVLVILGGFQHNLIMFPKIVCQLCWHAKIYQLVAVNQTHNH